MFIVYTPCVPLNVLRYVCVTLYRELLLQTPPLAREKRPCALPRLTDSATTGPHPWRHVGSSCAWRRSTTFLAYSGARKKRRRISIEAPRGISTRAGACVSVSRPIVFFKPICGENVSHSARTVTTFSRDPTVRRVSVSGHGTSRPDATDHLGDDDDDLRDERTNAIFNYGARRSRDRMTT